MSAGLTSEEYKAKFVAQKQNSGKPAKNSELWLDEKFYAFCSENTSFSLIVINTTFLVRA